MRVFINPKFGGQFSGVNFLGIKRGKPLVFDGARKRAQLSALQGSLHWRVLDKNGRRAYNFAVLMPIPVGTNIDRESVLGMSSCFGEASYEDKIISRTIKRGDKLFFTEELTLPPWLGKRLARCRGRSKTAETDILQRFRQFRKDFLAADLAYYENYQDEYAPDNLSKADQENHSATYLLESIFSKD